MPYTAQHKQETHNRILRNARRLFNRKGFAEVSIDEIMAGAGLTRGGFYRHFKSKDDLYSEAVLQFTCQGPARGVAAQARRPVRQRRGRLARMIMDAYLSAEHFEDRDGSCPTLGLPSDISPKQRGREARIPHGTGQHALGLLSPTCEGRTHASAALRLSRCVSARWSSPGRSTIRPWRPHSVKRRESMFLPAPAGVLDRHGARPQPAWRPDALAKRGDDGAPDHGMRLETLALHQELVQLRQPIEGNARVPMMLEVKADVARQDEDRLEPGRDGAARDAVLGFVAFDGAVLADQARVLECDMRRAKRHEPIPDESGPGPEDSQEAGRPTRRTRAARRSSSAVTGSTWSRPGRGRSRRSR